MRKLTAGLAALALVVILGGTAQAAHAFTGPNGTATKGAIVTFNVDWPHGSITLTCRQGTTQVLNTTQKINTGFLLDSAAWIANTPANCDALWFYVPGPGQPRVTEGELTFVADGGAPPPDAPVVLIVFENRPFSQIAGHAPYLNALAAQGRLFTHDVAVVHPSLPNYMAFSAGSTLGCSTDSICSPNTLTAENLYHQLEVAGISWNAFAEHMPTNCGLSDSGSVPNKYIAHHNPVVYFTDVHAACLTKSKPYSQIDPEALPRFTYISPGNEHNMHDGTVAQGDAWAAANIQPLVDAGAEVIVTFDEGIGTNQTIYTFVVGPGIAPSTRSGSFNDYSLLAGLETKFGLTLLRNAQTATVLPI